MIKIFILPSDANQNLDPTLSKTMLNFIPNRVSSMGEADVVLTVASYFHGYKFNEALRRVSKPLILMNYLEFGWDWLDTQSNVLGAGNLKKCSFLNTEDYTKLDDWIKDSPPKLEFSRELYMRDYIPGKRIPCEWLCYLPAVPAARLHTKEQFDARVFAFFHLWGLSNPMRQELHGDTFKNAQKCGYNILDNLAHEQHLEKFNVVSIYSPHFARASMENILRWQHRSKISVNLWGCGRKNFRLGESVVDCIMALPTDNMAWSYDFVHGENCIRLRPDYLLDDLLVATRRDDLYRIFLGSQEIADKYRSENWVRDYFMKQLEAVL